MDQIGEGNTMPRCAFDCLLEVPVVYCVALGKSGEDCVESHERAESARLREDAVGRLCVAVDGLVRGRSVEMGGGAYGRGAVVG